MRQTPRRLSSSVAPIRIPALPLGLFLPFWLSSPRSSIHLGVFALSLLLPPSLPPSLRRCLHPRGVERVSDDGARLSLSLSLSLPPSLGVYISSMHSVRNAGRL